MSRALGDGTGGLRMALSKLRRPSPDTAPTASKCWGLYMTGTLSRAAAGRSGHDDALTLDVRGSVAETTVTNIVQVRNDTLVPPPPMCFLDSLTKRHAFELARNLGLSVEERTVSLEDLSVANEFFVTGTSVEVRPVTSLDRPEKQSAWPVGPVTKALIDAFHPSTRTQA